MRIIIIGAEHVGTQVAESMIEQGHRVVVVEKDAARAAELNEILDARVVLGDGTSASLLKELEMDKADCVITLTGDAAINIYAASVAKGLGAKAVWARTHSTARAELQAFDVASHFGLTGVMNPEALCAHALAQHIRRPGANLPDVLVEETLLLQSFTIHASSPLAKQTLKAVNAQGLWPENCAPIMLQEDEVVAPQPANAQQQLYPGARISLLGSPESLKAAEKLCSGTSAADKKTSALNTFNTLAHKKELNVMCFGGDEIAVQLVEALKSGPEKHRYNIQLIERDEQRCVQLAERFPAITVLHGSATSLRLLEEEHIERCDVFVACTLDDEDNLMTCLQASELGVKDVQLILNRPDYENLLGHLRKKLNIANIISPRQVTAKEVLSIVAPITCTPCIVFENSPYRVYQVMVVEDSKHTGKPVHKLKWPQGTQPVGIHRGKHAWPLTPGATDKLTPGDVLFVLAPENTCHLLNHVL